MASSSSNPMKRSIFNQGHNPQRSDRMFQNENCPQHIVPGAIAVQIVSIGAGLVIELELHADDVAVVLAVGHTRR